MEWKISSLKQDSDFYSNLESFLAQHFRLKPCYNSKNNFGKCVYFHGGGQTKDNRRGARFKMGGLNPRGGADLLSTVSPLSLPGWKI